MVRRAAASCLVIALATAALRAQGTPLPAVIAPADNLVVDGVPAIPASLAAEVRRYTE